MEVYCYLINKKVVLIMYKLYTINLWYFLWFHGFLQCNFPNWSKIYYIKRSPLLSPLNSNSSLDFSLQSASQGYLTREMEKRLSKVKESSKSNLGINLLHSPSSLFRYKKKLFINPPEQSKGGLKENGQSAFFFIWNKVFCWIW